MGLAVAPAGPVAGPGNGEFSPPVSYGNGTTTPPFYRVYTFTTFGGGLMEWCCAAPDAQNPTLCIWRCWHCETSPSLTSRHSCHIFTLPMPGRASGACLQVKPIIASCLHHASIKPATYHTQCIAVAARGSRCDTCNRLFVSGLSLLRSGIVAQPARTSGRHEIHVLFSFLHS